MEELQAKGSGTKPTKAHNNSCKGEWGEDVERGLGLGFARPSYNKREEAFVYIYIHTYDILRVGLQIQPVKLNRRGGLKKRLERKYDYRKTKEARGRFGGPFEGDGGRVKVGPRPKQNTPLRKLFFKQSTTK